MPQDFVIFCRARTGSYSLVSRLNSCPDITCHGEVFKKRHVEVPAGHRRRLGLGIAERNAGPLDFLARLRALDPGDHVGFKVFPPHLAWAPGLFELFRRPEVRKVVLYREPLATYASLLRMQATGEHKLGADAPAAPAPKVRFARASFTKFAVNHNWFIALAQAISGLPNSFVLGYDQINDPDAIDALLRFLGSAARGADTATALRKQYAGTLEDAFENWDDFAAFLKKAPDFFPPPPTSHPTSLPPASPPPA